MVKHVLWIGGPPLSGKTTAARRLARRHGLRLYSSDTRTWAHRDRALAARVDAARRWESLAQHERWRQRPEDLLAMSLHRERGPMALEDLEGLPPHPLVVAEGSVLPASAVSSGRAEQLRSVWIVPTPDLYERLIAAHAPAEGIASLYRALRRTIEHEVMDADAPMMTIGSMSDLQNIPSAIERRFIHAIEEGPGAKSVEERQHLLREMNEASVAQVRGYYARPWAEGDPDAVRQDFVCECGAHDCHAIVELPVGRVASANAVLATHQTLGL